MAPLKTSSRRHRRRRIRRPGGALSARRRAGRHHAGRSAQPSSVPAAALSGRDRLARDLRDRLADPASAARPRGGHDPACRGDRRSTRRASGAARGRRRGRLRHAGARHRRPPRLFRPRRMGAVRAGAEDAGGRHDASAGAFCSPSSAPSARRDPERRAALLTFVIIGGGPTGVELAGTIAELARDDAAGRLPHIDTRKARVVLIEAGPRVLPGFAEDLSAYAQAALEKLGVESEARAGRHRMHRRRRRLRRQRLAAKNHHLGRRRARLAGRRMARRAGRPRRPPQGRAGSYRSRPSRYFRDRRHRDDRGLDGEPVPGIAPAAKQQGRYVADAIKARLRGGAHAPFHLHGTPAAWRQIGKRLAVIDFGWIKLRGAIAWWIWGFAHIYFLIGLRNRLSVALSWLWIYAARPARGAADHPGKQQGDAVTIRGDHQGCRRRPDRFTSRCIV